MSRDGSIRFDWAGAERTFCLSIGELRHLQETTKTSPFAVLGRLRHGLPMADDMAEVLRLGLEGAGETPATALALVRRYCTERPLAESVTPALLVLAAALYGGGEEEPGKPPGADAEPASSPPTDR